MISILDAIRDRNLFRPLMGRDLATWDAWTAFLAALFALPMSDEQLATYRSCTGRTEPPTDPATEAWLVVGRRGGKSFVLALIACYLATFREWREHLAPGERATVMVIAADRRQARVIMRYVGAILRSVGMLSRLIEAERQEGIDLSNSVTIEVHTASFRVVRGYTVVACLCDEIAFWRSEESANPDTEVINAIRPAMATVPGAMLLCSSSPYARRGALWRAHRAHHGRDGDAVLVWQADTLTMNPTVRQSVIDAAYEEDAASAAAEYGAQFRSDIESFVSREVVEACVELDCRERPALLRTQYRAFVDPSGGSADSMTLAISYRAGDRAVLCATRERRPPFSPEDVVAEFAALLRTYRINRVQGDRYAGEWPREAFRRHGITYVPSEKTKSDLYRDLLPALNSGRVRLLDDPRLVQQLVSLERRVGRSGRDSIDHAPGAHDDLANAAAGALVMAGAPSGYTLENVIDRDRSGRPPYMLRYCQMDLPRRWR